MKNMFRSTGSKNHTILDQYGKIVGHIRIKPNGILWKPKGGKGGFLGITLKEFDSLMRQHGREQKH